MMQKMGIVSSLSLYFHKTYKESYERKKIKY